METWRGGVQRLAVRWNEHGKSRRQTFSWTLAGLEEAKALNVSLRRAYTKEAMANGFNFSSAYEVMQRGLNGMNTTTPDFNVHSRLVTMSKIYNIGNL